jgi:uncharacterized protein YgfB (UPF0149 family)
MNYENLQGLLRDLTADSDIAEAHGMLCGLLCANDAFKMQDWLEYTLGRVTICPKCTKRGTYCSATSL